MSCPRCPMLILALILALALVACSKAERAGAASAPAAKGSVPAGVRIVLEDAAVNVDGWLKMQRTAQLGCFLAQQGRKPETVADTELVTWEQAQRLFTFREERIYTKDAFLLDETRQFGDIDPKTCRWVEQPPRRKLLIARGCTATEVDFHARTINERPVGTPECLAARAGAGMGRRPEDFIDSDGERRVVAGQPCRMQTSFEAGSRACVLEAMPVHPLADDRVVVAHEADPETVENARKARAQPAPRDLDVVLAAGLQLPHGLQGQASVVEVGQPIPPERFAIPAEAREFERQGTK